MRANGIHACKACDGQGFEVQRCGCRAASCPHESFFGRPEDAREGLYQKFWVSRTDGSSVEGGKHHKCDYFVLDWKHDPFAVPAARAYADACEATHPDLAVDLRARADKAEKEAARERAAPMPAWTLPFPGDTPLPEDAAIKAAHPTRTGRHDLYAEAMRLVGARRSKGGLVELVCWLLGRAEKR